MYLFNNSTRSVKLASRLITLFLLFASIPAFGVQNGGGRNLPRNEPGVFDYYVLSLSWSPTFCEANPDDSQCTASRPFGFVVHGLWPQYEKKGWPQFCDEAPGLSSPDEMLDIMPDRNLIRHEWKKHGTCTGMDATEYFSTIRLLFERIELPLEYKNPSEWRVVETDDLKEQISKLNSGWPPDDIVLICKGNRLTEVRLCLDREFQPRECASQRGCRLDKVVMPSSR